MGKPPNRPRDPNQLARAIVGIATGDVHEAPSRARHLMADLVAVVEAAEALPSKRGPYKKRIAAKLSPLSGNREIVAPSFSA